MILGTISNRLSYFAFIFVITLTITKTHAKDIDTTNTLNTGASRYDPDLAAKTTSPIDTPPANTVEQLRDKLDETNATKQTDIVDEKVTIEVTDKQASQQVVTKNPVEEDPNDSAFTTESPKEENADPSKDTTTSSTQAKEESEKPTGGTQTVQGESKNSENVTPIVTKKAGVVVTTESTKEESRVSLGANGTEQPKKMEETKTTTVAEAARGNTTNTTADAKSSTVKGITESMKNTSNQQGTDKVYSVTEPYTETLNSSNSGSKMNGNGTKATTEINRMADNTTGSTKSAKESDGNFTSTMPPIHPSNLTTTDGTRDGKEWNSTTDVVTNGKNGSNSTSARNDSLTTVNTSNISENVTTEPNHGHNVTTELNHGLNVTTELNQGQSVTKGREDEKGGEVPMVITTEGPKVIGETKAEEVLKDESVEVAVSLGNSVNNLTEQYSELKKNLDDLQKAYDGGSTNSVIDEAKKRVEESIKAIQYTINEIETKREQNKNVADSMPQNISGIVSTFNGIVDKVTQSIRDDANADTVKNVQSYVTDTTTKYEESKAGGIDISELVRKVKEGYQNVNQGTLSFNKLGSDSYSKCSKMETPIPEIDGTIDKIKGSHKDTKTSIYELKTNVEMLYKALNQSTTAVESLNKHSSQVDNLLQQVLAKCQQLRKRKEVVPATTKVETTTAFEEVAISRKRKMDAKKLLMTITLPTALSFFFSFLFCLCVSRTDKKMEKMKSMKNKIQLLVKTRK